MAHAAEGAEDGGVAGEIGGITEFCFSKNLLPLELDQLTKTIYVR